MKCIALAIVTIGLCFMGFHYESGWALCASVYALLLLADA